MSTLRNKMALTAAFLTFAVGPALADEMKTVASTSYRSSALRKGGAMASENSRMITWAVGKPWLWTWAMTLSGLSVTSTKRPRRKAFFGVPAGVRAKS